MADGHSLGAVARRRHVAFELARRHCPPLAHHGSRTRSHVVQESAVVGKSCSTGPRLGVPPLTHHRGRDPQWCGGHCSTTPTRCSIPRGSACCGCWSSTSCGVATPSRPGLLPPLAPTGQRPAVVWRAAPHQKGCAYAAQRLDFNGCGSPTDALANRGQRVGGGACGSTNDGRTLAAHLITSTAVPPPSCGQLGRSLCPLGRGVLVRRGPHATRGRRRALC